MDENKHPVYDMRTEDPIQSALPTVADKASKLVDIAVKIKIGITLIIAGPILGFMLMIIGTSIFGGHVEGIPATILLIICAAVAVGLPILGIIKIVRAIVQK